VEVTDHEEMAAFLKEKCSKKLDKSDRLNTRLSPKYQPVSQLALKIT